jgi:hypothetical protein
MLENAEFVINIFIIKQHRIKSHVCIIITVKRNLKQTDTSHRHRL